MKAFVTSVGEKTTQICCDQLKRFGFEVILLDKKEPWFEKYKRFIVYASNENEDCLRIDADVIVNSFIVRAQKDLREHKGNFMMQYTIYDFYLNGIKLGQPVLYSKGSFKIIMDNFKNLDERRPEASAWRLKEINHFTKNIDTVVGMHGFFQNKETVERAELNKRARKQIGKYDFALVEKLMNL